MYKVFNIGTRDGRNVEIEVKVRDGNLSITGSSGYSFGQIDDELRERIDEINFENGWNKEKLLKLLDIWDEWHLNYMHPECEHQRELGWDKEGKDTVQKYTFLKDSIVHPICSAMPYKKVIYTDDSRDAISIIDNMKAMGYDYEGVESVTRGWIPYNECPEYGILGKSCPVCGYRYGTGWKKVELPSDVVSFLEGL